MKYLTHPLFEEPIELTNEYLTQIVIEGKDHLYSFLINLNKQVNKNEYVDNVLKLYADEKELRIANEILFISSIIDIDINDKKIKSDLVKRVLKEAVHNDINDEQNLVNKSINLLLQRLFSDYYLNITWNEEFSITEILKISDVSIKETSDKLLERIITLIKVYIEIFKIEIFIFYDMFKLLQAEDIDELAKYCRYNKIFVVDISPFYLKKTGTIINHIIDTDLCYIKN